MFPASPSMTPSPLHLVLALLTSLSLCWHDVCLSDDVKAVQAADSSVSQVTALQGNADDVEVEGQVLLFRVNNPSVTRVLTFPRLHSRLKSVSWDGDPNHELTLKPEIDTWQISFPKPFATSPHTIRVELLDAPILGTERIIIDVEPQAKETVLPAHFAEASGKKLRYEPQPHKNTLGYWTNPDDFASWTIHVDQPSRWNLDVLQGCGTGQGGSDVEFRLVQGGQTVQSLSYVVEETGHFQDFRRHSVGELNFLTAGDYEIQIRPEKMAAKAVMDVRQLFLTRE